MRIQSMKEMWLYQRIQVFFLLEVRRVELIMGDSETYLGEYSMQIEQLLSTKRDSKCGWTEYIGKALGDSEL